MAISFAQLRFAEPSPEARRLLWRGLAIGSVWRDEAERHEGLDKAGLCLFQVERGFDFGPAALTSAQRPLTPTSKPCDNSFHEEDSIPRGAPARRHSAGAVRGERPLTVSLDEELLVAETVLRASAMR